MKRVTVFCGSSFGTENIYEQQAALLGQTLAKRKIELVYGGANVGLMGAVANGVLSERGKVIGVLPMENYIAPTVGKWIIKETV